MRTQRVRFCAEPNAVRKNQIRGGGVGGRSIRADAVASSFAKVCRQSCGFASLTTVALPTVGQRKVTRQTINKTLALALHMVSQVNSVSFNCVDRRAKMENHLPIRIFPCLQDQD